MWSTGIRKGIESTHTTQHNTYNNTHLESGKELKGFYSNLVVYLPIDQFLESGKELKDVLKKLFMFSVVHSTGIRKGIERHIHITRIHTQQIHTGIRKGIESLICL